MKRRRFVYVPLPFEGLYCSNHEIGGARPLDDSGALGEPLSWACLTAAAADVMRAIFDGRLGDVPSRRAFVAGKRDDDGVRMCEACEERPARERATKCAACEQAGTRRRRRERGGAPVRADVVGRARQLGLTVRG